MAIVDKRTQIEKEGERNFYVMLNLKENATKTDIKKAIEVAKSEWPKVAFKQQLLALMIEIMNDDNLCKIEQTNFKNFRIRINNIYTRLIHEYMCVGEIDSVQLFTISRLVKDDKMRFEEAYPSLVELVKKNKVTFVDFNKEFGFKNLEVRQFTSHFSEFVKLHNAFQAVKSLAVNEFAKVYVRFDSLFDFLNPNIDHPLMINIKNSLKGKVLTDSHTFTKLDDFINRNLLLNEAFRGADSPFVKELSKIQLELAKVFKTQEDFNFYKSFYGIFYVHDRVKNLSINSETEYLTLKSFVEKTPKGEIFLRACYSTNDIKIPLKKKNDYFMCPTCNSFILKTTTLKKCSLCGHSFMWKCLCGKENSLAKSTCTCGISKSQIDSYDNLKKELVSLYYQGQYTKCIELVDEAFLSYSNIIAYEDENLQDSFMELAFDVYAKRIDKEYENDSATYENTLNMLNSLKNRFPSMLKKKASKIKELDNKILEMKDSIVCPTCKKRIKKSEIGIKNRIHSCGQKLYDKCFNCNEDVFILDNRECPKCGVTQGIKLSYEKDYADLNKEVEVVDFSIIKPKIFKFISLYEKYEIKDSTIEAKNMKLRSFYKTNMEIASKKDKARQENISALEKLVKDSKYIEAYSNLVAYNDIQITNSPVGIKIKTIHDEVQANLSACYDSIEKGNEVAAHTLRKKILSICVDADLNKISSYLKPKKVEGGKITIEKDDDGAYYAHITFNASKSKGIQYVLLKKENSSSTSYTDGEQIIIDDNLYYDDYEIHSNTTYYYSIYVVREFDRSSPYDFSPIKVYKNVTNVKQIRELGKIKFGWSKPENSLRVEVYRSLSTCLKTYKNDAKLVYSGNDEFFIDNEINDTNRYYYTFVTYYKGDNNEFISSVDEYVFSTCHEPSSTSIESLNVTDEQFNIKFKAVKYGIPIIYASKNEYIIKKDVILSEDDIRLNYSDFKGYPISVKNNEIVIKREKDAIQYFYMFILDGNAYRFIDLFVENNVQKLKSTRATFSKDEGMLIVETTYENDVDGFVLIFSDSSFLSKYDSSLPVVEFIRKTKSQKNAKDYIPMNEGLTYVTLFAYYLDKQNKRKFYKGVPLIKVDNRSRTIIYYKVKPSKKFMSFSFKTSAKIVKKNIRVKINGLACTIKELKFKKKLFKKIFVGKAKVKIKTYMKDNVKFDSYDDVEFRRVY